jgi:hypothetical protein
MKAHDNHILRLGDPVLRGYVIAAAASLVVIFAVQIDTGSPIAAGVPSLCGIAALLLRWTAMPTALLLTLGYLLLFPIGYPLSMPSPSRISDSYLRWDDLVLIAALIVYLFSQYRIFDLTPPGDAQTRRVEPDEMGRGLLGVCAAVVTGQVLWALIANIEPHFGSDAPFRLRPSAQELFRSHPRTQSDELSRFYMLTLFIVAAAGVAGLVFWYLRLSRSSPLEARLILTDTLWLENRREVARQETWRSHRLGHKVKHRRPPFRWLRFMIRVTAVVILIRIAAWILYTDFSAR